MSEPKSYSLHSSLGYRLSVASRLQEKRLEEKLKSLGLTRIYWCILLAVENEGLFTPSDIATFVGIDRTATSRALKQMEAAGLIQRAQGKEDRRTKRVRATEDGRQKIAQAVPFAQENVRLMDVKLTHHEQSELRRLLAKLLQGERIELSNF